MKKEEPAKKEEMKNTFYDARSVPFTNNITD
jgi:hypothetical protein